MEASEHAGTGPMKSATSAGAESVDPFNLAIQALGRAANFLSQAVEGTPEHELRVRLVVLHEEAKDVRRRVRALTDE